MAEKIVSVESAKGNAKSKAEIGCFDTILKLWSHRGVFPNGRRPFESFEPIFRALESLDPENEYPRYLPRWEIETKKSAREGKQKANAAEDWIGVANGIDRAARVLVQYALMQAAINAADEKTKTWINKSIDSVDSDEISVIIRVISARRGTTEEESKKEELQHHIDSIKSKIEKLDAFEKTCNAIKQQLDNELKSAEEEVSKILSKDKAEKPRKPVKKRLR